MFPIIVFGVVPECEGIVSVEDVEDTHIQIVFDLRPFPFEAVADIPSYVGGHPVVVGPSEIIQNNGGSVRKHSGVNGGFYAFPVAALQRESTIESTIRGCEIQYMPTIKFCGETLSIVDVLECPVCFG